MRCAGWDFDRPHGPSSQGHLHENLRAPVHQVTVNTTDAEAQTVYSYANIMSENVIIKSENQRLLDCLFDLKRQADVLSLKPEFFQSNEDNLKFYTGM